ncbi:uncharacterized protein LOC127870495 [Dreissena polymorpha]|uniref:Uncharacterized protein n=1 Tax=Dreissena polymorpha TaxID=45954 RepID=A0A9D4RRI4_DREPO|nr:uncharacterized protein LOC127870495 [Dreissena polymorpha]XP_052269047.1 uncharacterized protein LOC127870495 [Dreissena polymorpha]KAH3875972.1 hypothetical protein DPMN_039251 [Dreissena polymorpha]
MVLFLLRLYACAVVTGLYATSTESTITFLPLKGYIDLLECTSSSDGIAFDFTKASNNETVILAECIRDAKSCTLRSEDNYVVSKIDNGALLEILNLSDETYGNYTCFQISQRENAKGIYVGYTDETQSNAVKFTKILGRNDVLECELNNSISFKFKNASSGKEDVIAECVHHNLEPCYVSRNNNFKARKTITGGILVIKQLTKEFEGIFTCFETNNKRNKAQIRFRMSEEIEPTQPTSTLAKVVSTKTSDDALNTGVIIALAVIGVYAVVITVLLIHYKHPQIGWGPYCRTKKNEAGNASVSMDTTQQRQKEDDNETSCMAKKRDPHEELQIKLLDKGLPI